MPTFIRQALAGEPLTVTGDGGQTRSIQYVDDLVDGCLRLLRSTLVGPINIGNPYEVSAHESRCPLVLTDLPDLSPI